MINKDNLDFLKSKPEDKEFHSSRMMFCIRKGKVEIASPDITDSHIEWFEKEGWITEKNAEDFLKQSVRGFYLPNQNELYCYRGIGFSFDDKVLPEVLDKIVELKRVFNLNDDTAIHLGPKDSPVGGVEYQRAFAGTLKELIDKG